MTVFTIVTLFPWPAGPPTALWTIGRNVNAIIHFDVVEAFSANFGWGPFEGRKTVQDSLRVSARLPSSSPGHHPRDDTFRRLDP